MPRLPDKLFALINYHKAGQGILAQVLCRSRDRAIDLFSEVYEFDPKDRRLVVELGGLNLPYVQEMEHEQIRFYD